jgi:hypothetical protein
MRFLVTVFVLSVFKLPFQLEATDHAQDSRVNNQDQNTMATPNPRQGLVLPERGFASEAAFRTLSPRSNQGPLAAQQAEVEGGLELLGVYTELVDSPGTRASDAERAYLERKHERLGGRNETLDLAVNKIQTEIAALGSKLETLGPDEDRAAKDATDAQLSDAKKQLKQLKTQGDWAAKCLDESKLRSAHDLFNPGIQ